VALLLYLINKIYLWQSKFYFSSHQKDEMKIEKKRPKVTQNYIFLLILTRRSSVAPTALPPSWVPVTGDPRGIQRVKIMLSKISKILQ